MVPNKTKSRQFESRQKLEKSHLFLLRFVYLGVVLDELKTLRKFEGGVSNTSVAR